MVCYCGVRKILYLHVPKTGGLTIEKILIKEYGFKHFTFPNGQYEFLEQNECKNGIFRYILEYSEESKIYDLTTFTKFTFVRDPRTRAMSAVHFLGRLASEQCRPFYDNLYDFYLACQRKPAMYIHFIMTQSKCLEDKDGRIDFDHIGRFENFLPDLEKILFTELGLPRVDLTVYHENATDPSLVEFDGELVSRISQEIHLEDYERFGYSL
jgi:hypothetical protein